MGELGECDVEGTSDSICRRKRRSLQPLKKQSSLLDIERYHGSYCCFEVLIHFNLFLISPSPSPLMSCFFSFSFCLLL